MFTADDSPSLTLDELTWLSASTLIENQHALSESPSPDRDSRALFNAVFSDSQSELGIEPDEDSPRPSRRHSPPASTSPTRQTRTQGSSGSGSPTPGATSTTSSISSTNSSSALPAQGGSSNTFSLFQPITPPPTPPRNHSHPRYLSHEPYSFGSGGGASSGAGALTPPSPSPSVSSSTLSSTLSRGGHHQTEWIYRKPKSTNSAGTNAGQCAGSFNGSGPLLSRHKSVSTSASASASASCSSRQVSRSPSICSSSYRTTAACGDNTSTSTTASTTTRSPKSKHGKHHQRASATVTSKPRPSSPIFLSSTSQLVDATSPDSPNTLILNRSPSLCSNLTTTSPPTINNRNTLVRSPALNASVSSLQLQSSIRVSPLKNRHGLEGGRGHDASASSTSSADVTAVEAASTAPLLQPQPPQPPSSSSSSSSSSPLSPSPSVQEAKAAGGRGRPPLSSPTGLERSLSNASTTTNKSSRRPIWSALRGGANSLTSPSSQSSTASTARKPHRNPILLKSIPSKSEISLDSSVTPTFVAPSPSASLPLFGPSKSIAASISSASSSQHDTNNSPRTPTRVRHTLDGTSTCPLPQKDQDSMRSFLRRDKFASAPPPLPVNNVGIGRSPSLTSSSHNNASKSPALGSSPTTPMTMSMTVRVSSPAVKVPSPTSIPLSRPMENRSTRRRRSSGNSTGAPSSNNRDRTSLTSQISIATATTAHTGATTGTSSSNYSASSPSSSSSSSMRSHPATPTSSTAVTLSTSLLPTPSSPMPLVPGSGHTPSKAVPVSRATYHFRRTSSSNSSTMMSGSPGYTPPSYHQNLHGLGNTNGNGGEKKSSLLFNHQQSYQHRHQRQNSSSSSVSFNGVTVGVVGGGSTAASVAAAAARSQAYARLTGTTNTAAGIRTPPNHGTSVNKRRRPSTSPGSGSGSETSLVNNSHPTNSRHHSGPYGYGQGQGLGLGLEPGSGSGSSVVNGSASTLTPSTSPPSQHHFHSDVPRPKHSSAVSVSHYGYTCDSRSPRTSPPQHVPTHHLLSSLPKNKSILTRASSMSTKNSSCGGGGGTTKSVKFVEIPEVHYRSGCYEQDGNEYVYGFDNGGDDDDVQEDEDEEDNIPAVGAKGEGQEGMVLRDCMGIDVEAIDMDIDTYLGTRPEEEEEKESKLSFRKMGWGFLSRGRKADKENRRGEDESKDSIIPPLEEKEKTSSGFGLKRLMGFATRKAPPPPLTLTISAPIPLAPKTTVSLTQIEENTEQKTQKQNTSPPVSPRKPISGPYILGSHLPSRSPTVHSPTPSPSSSSLHQPMSSRTIPASASNTSLNRQNGRQYNHQHPQSSSMINHGTDTAHRSRSLRSTHRVNGSLTTITNIGMNTERPVGPNIAGTRPKGFVVGADVLSLNVVPVPLKNAPSYESFRSAKSYGGRSVRSEVGSMKSVGGGSMRSFRSWMNRVGAGAGGGCNAAGVTVAVAE